MASGKSSSRLIATSGEPSRRKCTSRSWFDLTRQPQVSGAPTLVRESRACLSLGKTRYSARCRPHESARRAPGPSILRKGGHDDTKVAITPAEIANRAKPQLMHWPVGNGTVRNTANPKLTVVSPIAIRCQLTTTSSLSSGHGGGSGPWATATMNMCTYECVRSAPMLAFTAARSNNALVKTSCARTCAPARARNTARK